MCPPHFLPFTFLLLVLFPNKKLIHHLSYPKGLSVNDGIPDEHTSVHYATVTDAIRLNKRAGPGCFLAKTDIKSASRIIPIYPKDYPLLGIKSSGLYFYDRCMPMGCASSCTTFEIFSTAVKWIAQNKLKIDKILHLLDDFLIVSSSSHQCQAYLDIFIDLCDYLGVPLAPEKTCGEATTLSFAGIELDSIKSEARLPQEKVFKCVETIFIFLSHNKVTLKEIQSLIGLLNFACSVIAPGRAFLWRLIDLTHGITKAHHFIRLCHEVKEDLRVWLSFLSSFNGKSFFVNEVWCKLNLFTDGVGVNRFWCYLWKQMVLQEMAR